MSENKLELSKKGFEETFEDVCEFFGMGANEKAKNVISAVTEYAMGIFQSSQFINVFFADHGWTHSVRMSGIAAIMMKQLKKEYVEPIKAYQGDMLVLLWVSIALHDIGMTKIDEETNLNDFIKSRPTRNEHVIKSGNLIEEMIKFLSSKESEIQDEGGKTFLSKWDSYWETRPIKSIVALRLVKDAVLMHGQDEDWLCDNKIGSIEKHIFRISILDEAERTAYKSILKYIEAVLCLADLLDIGKGRMQVFANPALNKNYGNLDDEEKKITFHHWVSHKITDVNYEDYQNTGVIQLKMHMYQMDSNMYLNAPLMERYQHLGAVKSCLEWGNKEALCNILKDFGYEKIEYSLCDANTGGWRDIDEKYKQFNLCTDDKLLEINSIIGGTSNAFVNELVHQWIASTWEFDIDYISFHEQNSVVQLLNKGMSLHLLYDKVKKENIEKYAGYYVGLIDKSVRKYQREDLLLVGLNVFYEAACDRGCIAKVKIVEKGSDSFSKLYNGNIENGTAYIVIIKNQYEDNLSCIIENIENKEYNSFVIFVTMENNLGDVPGGNCQKIIYDLDENECNEFREKFIDYLISTWKDAPSLNEREKQTIEEYKANKEIGIGELLKQIKVIHNGIAVIQEEIYEELEGGVYESFFIVNLFEMMSTIHKESREVCKEELHDVYNDFCKQTAGERFRISNWDRALKVLLKLCDEEDKIIRLKSKYNDTFQQLIVETNNPSKHKDEKELFQMVSFFWLYNYSKVNYKSICYRRYLTYLSPKRLCEYILKSNRKLLIEKINIAFETSEIIADELKNNNPAIDCFAKKFFEELLRNRHVLKGWADYIAFQCTYRLFRGILGPGMNDKMTEFVDLIRKNESDVGYLGVIESICSASEDIDYSFKEYTNGILQELLAHIFKDSEQSIQYMAYDILYKYTKMEPGEKYYKETWQEICDALHSEEGSYSNLSDNDFKAWLKMREKFLFVITKTSSNIRKRNKVFSKS